MINFLKWVEMNQLVKPKDAISNDTKAAGIIYIAAILTREAQETLWKSISDRVAIPADWKKYCHHMTIRFNPGNNDNLPLFGDDISLVVTEVVADNRAVAVKVEPNTNKKELHMPADKVPHVTIATAPGTPPVYSNELIQKTPGMKMPQALILPAFTGAKLKNGAVMPERKDAALESFI
jgi:tRNA splicing ligase